MDKNSAIILTQSKSLGVGVVLALLFGGLGLFYSTITGGIVVTIIEVIALIIAVLTLGVGSVLFPIVHIVALIWAITAIGEFNKKLVSRQ
jgi:hypothetical protein